MKAMILAAGRGERLRPITDTLPKPLIHVGKYRLIEWHIHHLALAGINEIIINLSHLGDMIRKELGNGNNYGVTIHYSQEPEPALETAGGIVQALELLGPEPFMVVNGDIWTDYPFTQIQLPPKLAHLVMVDNPTHHPQGDFILQGSQLVTHGQGQRYTFSGIAVYRPEFFADCKPGRLPLAPLLKKAIDAGQLTGEYYAGHWYDIGTEQRLRVMREFVVNQQGDQ